MVGFWSNVYDYKMSCMKSPVLVEASIEVVPEEKVISDSALIKDLNLNTCNVEDTEFESDFVLKISKSGDITAIAGYFDTIFDLPEKVVSFTTGPSGTPTHWKQTLFYLEEPLKVEEGQELKGHIQVKRLKRDVRGLEIKLSIENQIQMYTLE